MASYKISIMDKKINQYAENTKSETCKKAVMRMKSAIRPNFTKEFEKCLDKTKKAPKGIDCQGLRSI